jgi:HEAT repeat protein
MDLFTLWETYQNQIILVIITASMTIVITQILPWLVRKLIQLLSWIFQVKFTFARFEQRYLRQLMNEHKFLNIKGIVTKAPVAIELEDVYIGQRAAARRSPVRQTASLEASKVVALTEVLKDKSRLVVIGAPGTGKTTFVSYLILKCAKKEAREKLGFGKELIPIVISLRSLKKAAEEDHLPSANDFPDFYAKYQHAKEPTQGFFKYHLERGNCLVLFDGLDEVDTIRERNRVAEWIDNEIVNNYPENRYVLTCRPLSYQGTYLSNGFAEFEICDLTLDDAYTFIGHWYRALERISVGEGEEAQRRAEEESTKLVRVVQANERLKKLVMNPLLLTIIALLHHYRGSVPHRRVDLYNECTHVLLGYWDIAKGIVGVDPHKKRVVLEVLAFEFHSRGIEEADRYTTEGIIAKALPTINLEPEKAAEFLEEVRERSGLLIEKSFNIYSFSHLTFQEYLTAQYLAAREDGLDIILQKLYDPRWLEVILLYSAMKDATALIRAILQQKEDIFYGKLLLAARCLAEAVAVDQGLRSQILDKLCELALEGRFTLWRESAVSALKGLSDGSVLKRFLAKLYDPNSVVKTRAIFALGKLGQNSTEVKAVLLDQLRRADSPEVLSNVIHALTEVAPGDPEVVSALRDHPLRTQDSESYATPGYDQFLKDDLRSSVTADMLAAIEEVDKGDSAMVSLLLERLKQDQDHRIRALAARVLGEIGDADLQVISVLLDRLKNDSNLQVQDSCMEALKSVCSRIGHFIAMEELTVKS